MIYIALALIGSSASQTIELSNKFYSWEKNPNVYICEESDIEIPIILSSLAWWYGYNLRFGNIILNAECKGIGGGIYIFGSKELENGDSGLTKIQYYDKNNITYLQSAAIYISPKYISNHNVIYHEVGHALGLNHSDDPLDIMYYKPLFLNITTIKEEE